MAGSKYTDWCTTSPTHQFPNFTGILAGERLTPTLPVSGDYDIEASQYKSQSI